MRCESMRLDVGCRVAPIYRILFVSECIAVDEHQRAVRRRIHKQRDSDFSFISHTNDGSQW